MSRIVIILIIYHHHKPINSINLMGSQRGRNMFPVRYGQTYKVDLSFKQKTGQWIMSRFVTVLLINYRHEPIDSINLTCTQRRRNVFPVR
jgi:hypothetical protein